MRKIRMPLFFALCLLAVSVNFPGAAQGVTFTVSSYLPAASETPAGSRYFVVTTPFQYNAIDFQWNFSKGIDGFFAQDITNITWKEKGSATEYKFDISAGTRVSPIPGSTDSSSVKITNTDYTYIKEGKDPNQTRRLELTPKSVTFQTNKTYVITIYSTLNSSVFTANNTDTLIGNYSFEFQTASVDTDADGIEDDVDNCPSVYNPHQLDGNTNGQGDCCDASPGCGGCGQPACDTLCGVDTDGDGYSDNRDNCPALYNPNQLDANKNGQGDCCDTTPECGGCGQPKCDSVCAQQ